MAIEIEFEGKTLEEALRKASLFFNVNPSLLDYQVIEEGGKGFFGRSGCVKIVAKRKETSLEEPKEKVEEEGKRTVRKKANPPLERESVAKREARTETRRGRATSQRREIANFLKDIFSRLGFRLKVEVRGGSKTFFVNLRGKDRRFLLINGGEPLSSLQFLLNKVFGRKKGWNHSILLDSDGFRRRREDRVREMALEAAEGVKATGEAKLLPPMNPYERRLVHLTVKEIPGVTTESQGEGFIKQVLVKPDEGDSTGLSEKASG